MPLDRSAVADRLRHFNFPELFTQELGWDNPPADLPIVVGGEAFTLRAVAQKRGMVAYHLASPVGGAFPDQRMRRRIEREVAKSVREHFIIFTDAEHSVQIWQWVRREPGRPTACRETAWRMSSSPEPIIQRLAAIAIEFDEEDTLTLIDVTVRAVRGFDLENITRGFYERFKAEHAAFLPFLTGIPDAGLQRWYASVMLNRLMFLYFIQKKGFLAADDDYLPRHLAQSRTAGRNFYRDFLCPLFFEGLAKPLASRSAATNALLGEIPYFNGGIFQQHEVERLHGQTIQVADDAFERIFAFFRGYQWHLDDRPLRRNDEINPDVLGYIFEKYINQKQMGAYYTKEDITEYISKNCIVPFLLTFASNECHDAFDGQNSVWRLLVEQPDRYINDALKHGVDQPLPAKVALGLDDPGQRGGWNRPAPDEYGLPTETWREAIARRQRCSDIRQRLASGEARNPNALITFNLNIRQFAQDVIENADANFLSSCYNQLHRLSVLDPTCGSGAFLFAALLVLEPLYAACLDRMGSIVDEWQEGGYDANNPQQQAQRDRFESILADAASRPSERYFILKNIVTRNLYGVDIMEEAIEICKLRLFLKLVAQVEPDPNKPNFGIEPLPDIDFNVRVGNTLVGYATRDEVRRAMQDYGDGQMRLGVEDELQSFALFGDRCSELDTLFQDFRSQQTVPGGSVVSSNKQTLIDKLGVLDDELNRYLAKDFGVQLDRPTAFKNWLVTHKPFHWFVEFHEIMARGGFDVIVGNPPYLEFREVNYGFKGFATEESSAVHALCMERSLMLCHKDSALSMIVPLSLVSTQRMKVVQNLIEAHGATWYANFSWRPAKLFDAVNRALTIFTALPHSSREVYTTGYQKWTAEDRDKLIDKLVYTQAPNQRNNFWVPKFQSDLERDIYTKVVSCDSTLSALMNKTGPSVYYRTTGGLYWKVFTDFSPRFRLNGVEGHSSRETSFHLKPNTPTESVVAVLSSNLFWWWYTITSNCRDLNPSDLKLFPIPQNLFTRTSLTDLGRKYLDSLQRNSTMLVREQRQTGRTETQSFKILKSKPEIDAIDRELAQAYGLNEQEVDFIISYDIKYRMGHDTETE